MPYTPKKSMLFIGHAFHAKTKSTVFFLDILKKAYEIRSFSFDPFTDDPNTHFRPLYGSHFDVVVILQVMPDLEDFHRHVSFGKCIFVPMFDYLPPLEDPAWEPYRNTLIICFSNTLSNALSSRGFQTRFIRYFPPAPQMPDFGDTRKLFFWQRTPDITLDTVTTLFGSGRIDEIHHHQALDPGFTEQPPMLTPPCPVTTSSWFPNKNDLLETIASSGLYMAPRSYEGIGMSFLEAMAMGRCVIAPDNPTMSEYIEHGKTGLLYDVNNPMQLPEFDTRAIQHAARQYMENGRREWEQHKEDILLWIQEWTPPAWTTKRDELPARTIWKSRTITIYKLFCVIPFLRVTEYDHVYTYWFLCVLPFGCKKLTNRGMSFWMFGLLRILNSEVKHG